jgi:hypothetical protein
VVLIKKENEMKYIEKHFDTDTMKFVETEHDTKDKRHIIDKIIELSNKNNYYNAAFDELIAWIIKEDN